ncbi:MAG: hypothetical protein GTN49_07500 [candidate division Zixibacteria bacterium]|nr:hypothetical protein [candidate division Zixibacteria bacterium]
MKSRANITVCVILFPLVAAGVTRASVGSVISSFELTGSGPPRATGIYRDWTYVYGVLQANGASYLKSFTADGSVVGSRSLPRAARPRDADHSTLGTGYVDVFDIGKKMLLTYTTRGGFLKEKPLPSDTTAYAYIPGNNTYFIAREEMIFRYTLDDVVVNKFYVGGTIGGLAATPAYNRRNGQYVVIGREGAGGYSYVYTGGGSLVDSFVVPGSGTYGSVVGRAAPPNFARTYWCNQDIAGARWAYQVDIGGTGIGVAPASIGKIKTFYR